MENSNNGSVKIEDGVIKGLVIDRTWETTNDNKEKVIIAMDIDLDGVKIEDIIMLAVSTKVIRRQAQERKCTKETLEGFIGQRIHFSTMGHKIVDPEQARLDVLNNAKNLDTEAREKLIAQLMELE